MLNIGEYNKLKALRSTSVGYYLGDEEGREVLLPNKYVPVTLEVGDEIEVFLYNDSEDRLIATILKPKITLNHFAYLQVKDVGSVGAFMDWGLEKDLLVPFSQQKLKLQKGNSYIVFLYLDKVTGRLVGTCKIDNILNNRTLTIQEKDEVDLLVYQKTSLGYGVIINNLHKGLIYNNEVFQSLNIGRDLKGYVKKIRENNLVDISLQQLGADNIEPSADIILEALRDNHGFLPLNDDSDPQMIYGILQMSKKSFKKGLGKLYKERRIKMENNGIYLL